MVYDYIIWYYIILYCFILYNILFYIYVILYIITISLLYYIIYFLSLLYYIYIYMWFIYNYCFTDLGKGLYACIYNGLYFLYWYNSKLVWLLKSAVALLVSYSTWFCLHHVFDHEVPAGKLIFVYYYTRKSGSKYSYRVLPKHEIFHDL